jgi:hypothetical protein
MTVPVERRTESKFEIMTKANELAKYTVKICSNEKNFPKRYRWCITYQIVENAVEINCDINRANAIYVKTKADWKQRRAYQKKAQADIAALITLLDIAKCTFNINGKRMYYWCGLINDVRTKLKAWMESDEKRYSDLPD